MSSPSTTLGIDLASQPKKTAACVIAWEDGKGSIADLASGGLSNDDLVGLVNGEAVSKVAIDAPFGWPLPFIESLCSYRDGSGEWPGFDQDALLFRATDRIVWDVTGRRPMSVSTSWLVWIAMRCARLLASLVKEGPVDRAGSGLVVEVYPAAALRCWKLSPAESATDPGSYKGDDPAAIARRQLLVSNLSKGLEGVVQVDARYRPELEGSDDALDAFICALIARAVEVGHSDPVPEDQLDVAHQEGWIHLPTRTSLQSLGG